MLATVVPAGALGYVARDYFDAPGNRPIVGFARVVDGDGLEIGGVEIRLEGIDAPERNQSCKNAGGEYPCGEVSAAELVKLTTGRTVTCLPHGRDGRFLSPASR